MSEAPNVIVLPGSFRPEKLTIARRVAGMSKSELAAQVGVSHAAIGQFENGVTTPSPERVAQIGQHLGFPSHYFTHSAPTPEIDDAFFRRRRKTPVKELHRALAYSEMVAQLVQELETYVELPAVDVPIHRVSAKAGIEEVEEAAADARRKMGVTRGPAPRLARLLETRGIVVVRNGVVGPTVDAFSRIIGGRPIVVLNTAKNDTMRTRFDLAHELGHLVMHDAPAEQDRSLERQADQFAAAFLMPRDDIRDQLPRTSDLHAFLRVKEDWGVSVAALVRRARDLDVMSEHHYKQAQIRLRMLGWHKNEPSSGNGSEAPILWKHCLEVLDGAVEFHHIADDAGITVERAREAIGLAPATARKQVVL